MGHNPTKNPFTRARLGLDLPTQEAVDEYKARSVWSTWWKLGPAVRSRFFSREQQELVTRYGARLDELACLTDLPSNEGEKHFVAVCMQQAQPKSPIERLWLLVQVVCRYQRSLERAVRADQSEHMAAALRAENRALKAKNEHLEMYVYRLQQEMRSAEEDAPRSNCNVEWASWRFRRARTAAPVPTPVVSATWRWPPLLLPGSGDVL